MRVGPYEVVAPIGAGGMGEVYRARDERIGRDVAIKVLPADFAADPDRLRRFEQEARAAGQLNHPNILTVHDTGTHEGAPYIVAELLEGETLRERLRGGSLGIRKAVEIAVQIAHGLAAAHEKGIIHRDLKPANVFVTKDGHVKILDFGVAKLIHPEVKADPYAKTTTSGPTTEAGAVVGTAGYISPEQLRGQPADHRSDIFALGCVLYEMLSGKAPFQGDTGADIAASILHEEPAPITVPGREVPATLRAVVARCLEKQPEERFQSARDLAFDLVTLSGTSGEAVATVETRRVAARSRVRERLAWGVAAAIAAVAIGSHVAPIWLRRTPAPELVRFSVAAPAGGSVVFDATAAAISPDGRRLVFSVTDSAGTQRLWVRPLGTLVAQPLPGTENGFQPFWSPDSRFVGFFAGGKLRKVAVTGGAPEVICDASNGRGGSWSKDGVIVFAPAILGPLLRVSAEGGGTAEVARPDAARGETGLRFPCFLPDGRHFLYVTLPRRQQGFDVYVGSLGSQEARRIMTAGSAPIYAHPGYLLFAAGDRLVAQRFDVKRLQPVGDPTPLGLVTPISISEGASLLSASANGVLAHAETLAADTQLVWLDRAGRALGSVPLPPGRYGSPSLSPDDRWAIVSKASSPTTFDLWLVDLERAVATRLTFDGLANPGIGFGSFVVWSPDGRQAAFERYVGGVFDVFQVSVSGVGQPEQLVQSSVVFKTPAAWSPDGRYLVFSQNVERNQYDLWLLPLQGERTPVRYLHTPFNETTAAFSPDGRWLAYDSDETGTSEIYVRSFPQPGEKYRVSTAGGIGAQWSRDGKELLIWTSGQIFYPTGSVYSADVETTPTFQAGTPHLLFIPRQDNGGLVATSDLKRFLAVVPAEGAAAPAITVTLNWQTALER
jgi:Tol biopolymer transport system component